MDQSFHYGGLQRWGIGPHCLPESKRRRNHNANSQARPPPQGGGRRRRSRAARPSLRVGRWSLPATADRDGWPPPAVARPPGTESGVLAGSSAALLARVLVMELSWPFVRQCWSTLVACLRRAPGSRDFHFCSGSPSARRSDCKVVGRDEGVGMVVTQHPAAPGQGVLVECAGPLILAQRAQDRPRAGWPR